MINFRPDLPSLFSRKCPFILGSYFLSKGPQEKENTALKL
jgi:hypothetical protein